MLTSAAMMAIFLALAFGALAQPWIGFAGYFAYVALGHDTTMEGVYLPALGMQKLLFGGAAMGALLRAFRGLQPLTLGGRWTFGLHCFFIAWALVSALRSMFPGKSWWFMQYYWTIWLMCCLAMPVLSNRTRIMWTAWGLVLAGGFNALYVNRDYFQMNYAVIRDTGRNSLDNNTYGVSTFPLMALAAAFAVARFPLWQRAAAGGVLALQLHQMLLLDSRGGLIATISMFAIGLVLMPKTPLNLMGAALAAGGAMWFAGPLVVERFNTVFAGEEERDESAGSRFTLWKAGYHIMCDHPVMGVGVFAGERVIPLYRDEFRNDVDKALHNLFFDIGTGTGFVGAAAYLLMFAVPMAMAWRGLRRRPRPPPWAEAIYLATIAGVFSYWLASMFSSSALIENCYSLTVLTVATAAVDARRRGDFEAEAAAKAEYETPYLRPHPKLVGGRTL